jgi:aspartate/glutamate racemase
LLFHATQHIIGLMIYKRKINIPIINMPKEVFKFTKKNCKKNSKVGLLATEGTLKQVFMINFLIKITI